MIILIGLDAIIKKMAVIAVIAVTVVNILCVKLGPPGQRALQDLPPA